MPTFTIIK